MIENYVPKALNNICKKVKMKNDMYF